MKRKVIVVLAVIIFLVGAGFLLFPRITQWIYDQNVGKMEARFQEDIKRMENENDETDESKAEENLSLEELYRLMVRENERLHREGQKDLKDPFSYQNPGIDLTQYGIRDNMVGYIEIPKIGELLPIYLGASLDNMSMGAAHLTQTSYPVGGINTNSVLAAHRGNPQITFFRNINQLAMGDRVIIKNFRETLTYQVVETKVIKPVDIDQVLIQDGRDMVTLITCHPYGYNYQRYVVYCERIEG